jgi:hypothetical protein
MTVTLVQQIMSSNMEADWIWNTVPDTYIMPALANWCLQHIVVLVQPSANDNPEKLYECLEKAKYGYLQSGQSLC